MIKEIASQLYIIRNQIEVSGAWNQETISPTKVFDPQNPSSGQCAPTSRALLDILRTRFPNETFRFNGGALLWGSETSLKSHHWLTHHAEPAAEPTVLDITGDQFEGIEARVIANPLGELAMAGTCYLAYEQHDNPPDVLKQGLPGLSTGARAKLLMTTAGFNPGPTLSK